MKKIKNWLISLFRSPDGDASIKRVLGTLCILALIVALFISGYFKVTFDPNLVSAVTWVGAGCILGTVAEKFSPQITQIFDKISQSPAVTNIPASTAVPDPEPPPKN